MQQTHSAQFKVVAANGNTGTGVEVVNSTTSGYIDLPTPTLSYTYTDPTTSTTRSLTSQQLTPIRSATTQDYLYVLYGDAEAGIAVMERMNFTSKAWQTVFAAGVTATNQQLSLSAASGTYVNYFSLASAKNEIYMLYVTADKKIKLATISDESASSPLYDVDINSVAELGDMIGMLNGQLILAGKSYSTSHSGRSGKDVVAIYPDVANQIYSVSGINSSLGVTAATCGNISTYAGGIAITDSYYEANSTMYYNAPIYSNGASSYVSANSAIYTGAGGITDTGQTPVSAGLLTDVGVLEIGQVKNNGASNFIDETIWLSGYNSWSAITGSRFDGYKTKAITATTRNNEIFVIGKNGLDTGCSLRYTNTTNINYALDVEESAVNCTKKNSVSVAAQASIEDGGSHISVQKNSETATNYNHFDANFSTSSKSVYYKVDVATNTLTVTYGSDVYTFTAAANQANKAMQ